MSEETKIIIDKLNKVLSTDKHFLLSVMNSKIRTSKGELSVLKLLNMLFPNSDTSKIKMECITDYSREIFDIKRFFYEEEDSNESER